MKRIELPSGFSINRESVKLLNQHLSNRIVEREKRGENIGIDICISEADYLIVKYNNCEYKLTIVEKQKKYFWYLYPHKDSYFVYPANDRNSFDVVVRVIK